jgi:SET domain-containing protein
VPSRNRPLFELRRSAIQGRGAFALRRIRRGTRIIEYTGERISDDEADRRYDDDRMDRHHTFLFAVRKNVVIDAAVGGNEARFINHSCDPNCEAVIEDGRVFIEAVRTIQPGDELAYDYKYERDGDADESWEKLYVCRCGAANCRGTILQAPRKRRPKSQGASRRRRPAAGSRRDKGPSRGRRRETTSRRRA